MPLDAGLKPRRYVRVCVGAALQGRNTALEVSRHLCAVGIVLCILPLVLSASVSTPIPARTGGFGEPTCHECHWDNPLNDPPGRLRVEGIPDRYTAGRQYLLTVKLERPDLGRAGFQLSARHAGSGPDVATDAGMLKPVDTSVQLLHEKGVTYAGHTPEGAAAGAPGSAGWTLAWVAPEHDGDVVFHIAANAANDDESPLGDYIYTREIRTRSPAGPEKVAR